MSFSTFAPTGRVPRLFAVIAALAVLVVITICTAQSAFAQTETIVYNFCSATNCTDGQNPLAGLVMDASGNFYGTTSIGGDFNSGTVYKIASDGSHSVVYSFGTNAGDGNEPFTGTMVLDASGNLFGTTAFGGAHGGGNVFKISPTGEETVLYSFCSRGGSLCVDGNEPIGGLIQDKHGNLYGTTQLGGAFNQGTAFRLRPNGSITVLHSFGNGTDGLNPEGAMVMDAGGNLYGTTNLGGDTTFCGGIGCGTIFKIDPTGTETVLYKFCTSFTSICYDGIQPTGSLLLDKRGNLYGTTFTGGRTDFGTVFVLSPNGTEHLLHTFKNGLMDGAWPLGGLTMDSAGNVYGTTSSGGTQNEGAVYEITKTGAETILHSFSQDGVDGYQPEGNLVMDSSGNLWGTTAEGGSANTLGGTVFKITP
jgi:uncharacterized repeat protein (TIGR03803 family)